MTGVDVQETDEQYQERIRKTAWGVTLDKFERMAAEKQQLHDEINRLNRIIEDLRNRPQTLTDTQYMSMGLPMDAAMRELCAGTSLDKHQRTCIARAIDAYFRAVNP